MIKIKVVSDSWGSVVRVADQLKQCRLTVTYSFTPYGTFIIGR